MSEKKDIKKLNDQQANDVVGGVYITSQAELEALVDSKTGGWVVYNDVRYERGKGEIVQVDQQSFIVYTSENNATLFVKKG